MLPDEDQAREPASRESGASSIPRCSSARARVTSFDNMPSSGFVPVIKRMQSPGIGLGRDVSRMGSTLSAMRMMGDVPSGGFVEVSRAATSATECDLHEDSVWDFTTHDWKESSAAELAAAERRFIGHKRADGRFRRSDTWTGDSAVVRFVMRHKSTYAAIEIGVRYLLITVFIAVIVGFPIDLIFRPGAALTTFPKFVIGGAIATPFLTFFDILRRRNVRPFLVKLPESVVYMLLFALLFWSTLIKFDPRQRFAFRQRIVDMVQARVATQPPARSLPLRLPAHHTLNSHITESFPWPSTGAQW